MRIFFVALILTMSLLSLFSCRNDQEQIIAWINQEPILIQEYSFFADPNKASVFQYFSEKYHARASSDFWKRSYGKESPREMLRKLTLEKLVACKVVLGLAKSQGLIEDFSYSAFLQDLENENKARRKKIDSGQIIYGPVQWDAFTYFYYRQSNLEIALKQKIAMDKAILSESQLKIAWDSLKYKVFANDSLHFVLISVLGSVDSSEKAKAMDWLIGLRQRLELSSIGEYRSLLREKPKGYSIDTAFIGLSVLTRDGDGEGDFDQQNILRKLRPGQSGTIYSTRGKMTLPLCLDQLKGFQSYSLSKPTLEQLIVNATYERQVTEMIKHALVKFNEFP
jgi:hypothetical protein